MRIMTLALALLALGACAPKEESTVDPNAIRLVLAHPNVALGEEVFLYTVPKRLGYFRDEGIDVQMKNASSGVQAGQVLVTHGADFATLLAESLMMVREQGGKIEGFYQIKTNNGFSVSVLPGSPIRSLADLPGKRIGFSVVRSGADLMLQEQLRRMGLPTDYHAVAIGSGPAIATALRDRQVDAVVMWDAIEQILANNGLEMRHIQIPLQDQMAGYQIATTPYIARRYPELVGRFCRAVAKSVHFSMANPKAAVATFYEEFPTNLPAGRTREQAIDDGAKVLSAFLAKAQRGVTFGAPTGVEDEKRWQMTSDINHGFGILYRKLPVRDAYTDRFTGACNAFDRKLVARQAKIAPL